MDSSIMVGSIVCLVLGLAIAIPVFLAVIAFVREGQINHIQEQHEQRAKTAVTLSGKDEPK